MNFKENMNESLNHEQLDAVDNFLTNLFGDDIDAYWSSISKVDQARVYGIYIGSDSSLSFKDYVREQFMLPQQKEYENLKENVGIAQFIKYSEQGEPEAQLKLNTTDVEVYNEPTEIHGRRLTLALDTDVINKEIVSVWKVRMYSDKSYVSLNQ